MKIYIAVFFLLFVNACASIDTNRIAPGYADAFTSIKQLLLGVENNIEPEVGGEWASRSLAVIRAGVKSAREKRFVTIDEIIKTGE